MTQPDDEYYAVVMGVAIPLSLVSEFLKHAVFVERTYGPSNELQWKVTPHQPIVTLVPRSEIVAAKAARRLDGQ